MVVAVSSMANARRSDPAPSVVAGAPSARMRAPRPWAAPLPRPAARILVAGGLTLAGWLLSAALSNAGASADELPACTQPAATSHAHAAKPHHRKHAVERDACVKQSAPAAKTATETISDSDESATADEDTSYAEPSAKKQNTTKASSNGLLGGLLGGLVNVVGHTLQAVTGTVAVVGHTVLDPVTQPPASNPDAAPILPIGGVVDPILDGVSSSSGSGSVTATVPDAAGDLVATTDAVTAVVPDVVATAPEQQVARAWATSHVTLIPRHRELPASVQGPKDSGVHARTGGGDNGPGLPSAPSAPSAPAASAGSAHDGPGGARQQFAVHTDEITTTQLKLAGTNRDHAADGAGREAALPTTSPD